MRASLRKLRYAYISVVLKRQFCGLPKNDVSRYCRSSNRGDLGFCQHYRGVACSQLIGNRTVYVKASMTLNQMEEKLAAILTIMATGKEMSPECHKYAVPFFCYVMFSPCDDTIPYPVPRHVPRRL
ncbi:inactive tyrosine-protein kinase transmembrane receptor ROR1 [Caerostris extrusa]|uniref:Inactive tyrosine-protein kinase transmembrane receptor ROR1 n=1 Tax=Caerostris extrusa TaxID=172846 RepID=A0AAV4T1H5_CAEEX|nr:inactive tyrosine-protein kinase transmembrane receptor ROR1 [Caerostris extrusa]